MTSTWAPLRAAQISARCSSRPTLSSSTMKVSSRTSCRAWRMRSNARGKNSSPLISRSTALPSRHMCFIGRVPRQPEAHGPTGACRKTPGRRAVGLDEYLLELAAGELGIGPLTPVVELACDYHRLIGGQLVEQAAQQPQLLAPMPLAQTQVHTDRMQIQLAGHI